MCWASVLLAGVKKVPALSLHHVSPNHNKREGPMQYIIRAGAGHLIGIAACNGVV